MPKSELLAVERAVNVADKLMEAWLADDGVNLFDEINVSYADLYNVRDVLVKNAAELRSEGE